MTSVYAEALHRALPRLLASFNNDMTSALGGVGDRYHWSWKLIDFPNGTYQAAVHGLAILLQSQLLPDNLTQTEVLYFIRNAVRGLQAITAKNGSVDEALPNEASYCVTALVVSDTLAAREILHECLSPTERQEWLEIIRPLIGFLMKQDEHHALISNHLASGALAMFRWHAVTGDVESEARGKLWLQRILNQQSSEGWFSEYGDADPGYQTWCTTQLAQLHVLRPDLNILTSLSRSLAFLIYAAHPDGSFGGSYGSRNTRFLLPGGIELLRDCDKNAGALSSFARDSIRDFDCVTLDCIDAGNLVPFFNDYALAARAALQTGESVTKETLPCHSDSTRKWFPEAGWLIDSGTHHYSIINMKRGGATVHFNENKRLIDDPGTVAQDDSGQLFSSQLSCAVKLPDHQIDADEISLQFALLPVKRPVPGAFEFLILRLMCISIFKSLRLGNLVKRLLAYFLISRKPGSVGQVCRDYKLGPDLWIKDSIQGSTGLKLLTGVRHFSAIHMASQGYWQRNDGNLSETEK
jgi:hypothetical protein